MKLFHSSTVPVEKPDTRHSRPYLDFGKGFYLTTIEEQAKNYALRFLRRNRPAWINSYDFNPDFSVWNVKIFESYDREWLDFVSKCRAGDDETDFDLIIGGIANDKVIQTLDRYFAGELSVDDTLGLLKFEKPNVQYCIRSQALLDQCLKYIESINL